MEAPNTCPLESLLSQISGQWTLYILWTLHTNGELRFGELKRKVGGISTKILTDRLRMLEEKGFVNRHHKPTIPPKVSYKLTDAGKDLADSLKELYDFALRWSNRSDMGQIISQDAALYP